MKVSKKHIFIGILALSLLTVSSCNTSKKTSKKKKYSKKCGTCPTWGFEFQRNDNFTIINEEKV